MAVATKRKLDSTENHSSTKTPKLITTNFGASFRKRLKTENAINALKEFVETNKTRDVTTEYINAGGSAKELLALLKQFDGKKDLIVANTVLSALHFVVSKCNTDLLLIQKNVEEACEELLCNYQATLQNMLCSVTSSTSHRKVVLKLFTGMVNLSNGLAKRLLTLFPINLKTMKILTDTRSSNTAVKLRTSFIHYLLSFLVDDNIVLISELLQKKGLLTSIIPGLVNDEPNTVLLVLNTLRLKIVENIKISKTLKLHTFNTQILRSLEKLYDYSISDDELSEDREIINNVEQTIREAVHSLLMVLCTSHKKGILFKERGLIAAKSPNQLIFTLLESIQTPWENKLRTELVTEILKICPEFMKTVYHSMEQYVQPSVTEKWINAMNFIKKIIEKQELTCENCDEQQVYNFITSYIFPPPIQKILHDVNDENIHSHATIRFHILSLSFCVLLKIKQIFNQYNEHRRHKDRPVTSLEIQIDHFLNKNLIPSLHILNAWKSGITTPEAPINVEITMSMLPDLNEYFSLGADLLLLYSELTPLNFNQLRLLENIDLTTPQTDHPEVLFKIAQLVFLIDSPKPGQDQFAFMMKQFLQCYIKGVNIEQDDVIQNVLLSTGFFDGFEEEIIIWLRCIKNTPVSDAVIISNLVVETLCTLSEKYKKFIKDFTGVNSYEDDNIASSGPDANLFVEEYGTLLNFDNEFESVSSLPVKLSPVVPAFLYTLKCSENKVSDKPTISAFVSSILLHLLHSQSTSYGLSTLVTKYNNTFISKDVSKYLSMWTCDGSFDHAGIFDTATGYLYQKVISREGSLDQISSAISEITEMDCILLWNACLFYTIELEKRNALNADTISDIISILEIISDRLQTQSALCLKILLTNYRFVNGFSMERGKCNTIVEILLKTALRFERHEVALKYCSKFLSSYRLKFMLTVLEKMRLAKRIKINCQAYVIEDVIKFLMLPAKHVVGLLSKLLGLPVSMLINEKQTKLSEWSILIKCLLNEAANNLDHSLNDQDFNSLLTKTIEIGEHDVSTDDLECSIISYLCAFPHHIEHVSDDDLEKLLNSCHKRINKLAIFLVQYHPTHLHTLQSKLLPVKYHFQDVDWLFEVLSKIQRVGEIDEEILSQLYKSKVCNPEELLKDQYPILERYSDIITKIIRQFHEKKKCSLVCQNIESYESDLQLTAIKCHLLRVIYEKCDKLDSFVCLCLTKLNQILAPNVDSNWLCDEIAKTVDSMKDVKFLLHFVGWKDYVKLSLKLGLQFVDSTLIRTLNTLCGKLFHSDDDAFMEVSTKIFQMTISHSEFVNVMLGDSEAKCDLVELMITLTTANKSVMSSNHVPLLLGSYNASLSKSDQAIFRLLRWYEENGIRFSDCRPYLWGDAAVTHHSIRTEISVSLKRQPLPNQVLELLDTEIVKNTIRYFPLDRSLEPANTFVEYEHKMYDLSFVLPLSSHLLAPESRVSVQKFTRSGALALILCALSSEADDLRMAAYHCLQRFRAHLFSHEKEIQLWEHFVNALQAGIASTVSEKDDCVAPRLSCIVTTFLAQMSLIIGEPLHPLYTPLTKFLLAKPSFDISTIPNFLMLFYSIDEKHKDQQEWILNVIKYGTRYKADWQVSQKCFLFKLLLQYSFSSISNQSVNALILEVIAAGLRIAECRQSVITKYGFLSWFTQIIMSIGVEQKPLIPSIVEILDLLISAKNSSSIMFTALQLLRKIPHLRMEDDSLERLLAVLARICDTSKIKNILDEETAQLILDISTPLLSSESVKKYRNCLNFKSALVIRRATHVDQVDHYVERILRFYLKTL